MTHSQTLAAQIAELRKQQLGAATPDEKSTLQTRIGALEAEKVTAEAAEAADLDTRLADLDDENAMSPELRRLIRRAQSGDEFGAALAAVVNKTSPGGAVAELQAERGLPAHLLPMEAIMVEDRAAITGLTDAPQQQASARPYVFAAPIADYMGFQTVRVAYGTAAYPVFTTPADPVEVAEGTAVTETTAVIAADALEPGRVSDFVRYSVEDAARFAFLGNAVQQHVRAAWAAAVDGLVLANTTRGLQSITRPGDPGSETTFANYIAAAVGRVDGRYADRRSDVRMLVGDDVYAHMAGQYHSTAPVSALDAMESRLGGLRVGNGIPAPAANDQMAFSVGIRGGPHGVIPIWDGLQVISDPYTDAAKGEVIITVAGMANIRMLRADAYARHRFQVA